jgi:hypothetical protein
MAKKLKKAQDGKIVDKGLFRDRIYETSGDTYTTTVKDKKGRTRRTTSGTYTESDTGSRDTGVKTKYDKQGNLKSTKSYDVVSTNENTPSQRMTFPGMKKGGTITALDQVDRMYKAKYKKK